MRGRFGIGIGIGIGLPFGGRRIAWTPEKLVQPGDSWLWADLDAAGAVTLATQPTIPGAGWSGANWAGSGLGPYTHTAGATTSLTNAVLTVGLRYLVTYTVTGRSAGTVTLYAGATAGTARSTNATFVEELTCTTSTGLTFTPSSDFDGSVTVVSAEALSVAQVTCSGSLGNIAQATPANMQWLSDADAPTSVRVNGRDVLYFDGVADYAAGSGAASEYAFHKADGFTFLTWLTPDITAAGNDTLIDTCNASASNVGINITYDATAQKLWVRVANGSGTWVVNEGLPLAKGLPHLVDATWTEAAGLSLTVSSLITTRTVTQASTGAASAADATATLQVGRRSGAADYFHGSAASLLTRVGAVDAASLTVWRAWARAYYDLVETCTSIYATNDTTQNWTIRVDAGSTYTVDWGDGSADNLTGTGADQAITHNYAAAGTYTIRWTFSDATKVRRYYGQSNSVLTGDIGDLAGMTGMQYLNLSLTAVTGDIGDLAGMTGMQYLNLSSTAVTGDIGDLAGMTGMQQLYLSSTAVSGDIGDLAGLTGLRYLFLSSTAVSGDIGDLAGITGMQYLHLSSTAVSGDIGDLAGITGMRQLQLYSTAVTYTTTALPAWATCDIRAYSCGWNTATVDQFLIDLADGVGANGQLRIDGTNAARSAASDAAKAALLAAGWSPVEVNE